MLAVEDIFVVIGPDKKIIEIGLSTLLHYFIKYFEKNYETVPKIGWNQGQAIVSTKLNEGFT